MQAKILGFLCHNQDQEVYQKDIEEAFYIRRSTASRLLKRLEADGFILLQPGSWEARLKRVTPTPTAEALHQEIMERISSVERTLTRDISRQELDQFLATVEKLKRNLM